MDGRYEAVDEFAREDRFDIGDLRKLVNDEESEVWFDAYIWSDVRNQFLCSSRCSRQCKSDRSMTS